MSFTLNHEDQLARDQAVVAFLDITLGQWADWVKDVDISEVQEIEPLLVQVVTGLQYPERYQMYLQALAMLATSTLVELANAVTGKKG